MRRGIEKASRSRFVLIGLVVTLQVTLTVAVVAAFQYYDTNAAPANISACVNKYTGAVRMNSTGTTTCNANESTVSWSAVDTNTDTHGVGTVYGHSTLATSIDAGATEILTVTCDAGDVATGGGFNGEEDSGMQFTSSAPLGGQDIWSVEVTNPDAVSHFAAAYVICATP